MSVSGEVWLSEAEERELARLATGRTVLELGAWKGRSTVALASTAALVVSIDSHKPFYHYQGWICDENSLPFYLEAVNGLDNVVTVIADFSAASLYRHDAFGLVFVDGWHSIHSTMRDLKLASVFGCTIALHDYGRYRVKPACDKLAMQPSYLVDSLAVFEP